MKTLRAAAEREACAKVSLRPPQPAIFLSENISHAQFMAQFEEGEPSMTDRELLEAAAKAVEEGK